MYETKRPRECKKVSESVRECKRVRESVREEVFFNEPVARTCSFESRFNTKNKGILNILTFFFVEETWARVGSPTGA